VLLGIGVGATVATAVAAIAASIVEWTVRSSRDFTTSALTNTGMGAFPIVIAGVLGDARSSVVRPTSVEHRSRSRRHTSPEEHHRPVVSRGAA
jgi:hypothetical protein